MAFLRFLLWLYPPGFRRRFGVEMTAFVESRAAAQTTPRRRVIIDVLVSLPSAWFAAGRALFRRHGRRPIPLVYSDVSPHPVRKGFANMVTAPLRDLRFAVRNLSRTPGFTAVAVLTLAIGVGANTAIFSVVNGVMLRPLPYHDPDELFMIKQADVATGTSSYSLSQPDLTDIQDQVGTIASAAGYHNANFTLTGVGEPEVVGGARLTNGFFEVFHVQPVVGRDLRREDNVPGGPLVAVIGHAFWQERFGADPGVIGTTIELSEKTYEIVGVAPPEFDYPNDTQIWVPRYHDLDGCARGCRFMRVIARIGEGRSAEAAQAELDALSLRLEEGYPDTNFGNRFQLEPIADTVYGSVRLGLWVMLGAVGLVLLIACANVANLLLVRGTARSGEMAVRSALGAGRGRLVAQLLTEAFVLAALGGMLGVGIARMTLGAILRLAPPNLPRVEEITIDGTVLLFALGAIAVVTVLFGLLPALRLATTSVAETLNHGGRGDVDSPTRAWTRSVLLIGEVALSLVLLFGAGLLVRSFAQLSAVELGFDKERVLTFLVSLPEARYGPDESVQYFDALEERIRSVPGVESVGGALGSPLGRSNVGGSFQLLDRPEPPPGQDESAAVRAVTRGYLETLRVPVLRGRGFEPSDRWGTRPVVLVSSQFAQRYYPDKDPLGQQIELHVSFGYPADDPYTIVGVVGDLRSRSVRNEPTPEIYVVQPQVGTDFLRMLVRLTPGTTDVLPAIRREARAVDPNVPVRGVEMLEETVQRAYGPARFYLVLLTIFAGVAVSLAAVGLFGVVAYVVSRRTREIGIRIALGAKGPDVVRLVMHQSLRPAVLGIGIGLLGAWLGARVLQSLLYNVVPHDPVTLVSVTAVLLGVVALAILLPASRASRIAPVVALRGEG